jgi:hypothetical protein
MKKFLFVFILVLFTGCNSNNLMVVEGTNDREIKACELIKEFSLSRGSIQDYSDIKCEFIDEKMEDNSIPISIKHKDYQDIDNKVLVIPEKNIFFYINGKKAFIKQGREFNEITQEEAENYLKQ